MKTQVNIRLTPEIIEKIAQLRVHLGGLSQAAVIAMAVENLARKELPKPSDKRKKTP